METQDIDLHTLVGTHVLDACDTCRESIKATWGDYFEDCEVIRFRLDGITYSGIEDPSDGYRSSMGHLRVSNDQISNVFPPITVLAKMKDNGPYGTNDVLQLIDLVTAKPVIEVGTSNTDNYYPSFVGDFCPENMATNSPPKESP